MFPRRENEPEYALLNDPETQLVNRYGKPVETVPRNDSRRLEDFVINGESQKSPNPNRYRQHGFFFTADNCIACHACEAACSEKNDNPAHLAFRSVGFVEGGSYPDYRRINISMACNHCDDPVCLKGCPTRAYTKFAEYGAVLQDPDICFGCGYCTWVCPYNAPQLDPVKGQVSKCNMCVDRLEVGLKPACVSACLGKALEFGVIENIPEGREQAKTGIPGFPRTDITYPNIRFQQKRSLPREMKRVDSTPLKYRKDDREGKFKPVLDPKQGFERKWNLKKLLGSHENAHIAFTLSAQAVMGAFALLVLGSWTGVTPLTDYQQSAAFVPVLILMVMLMGFGMFKLNMHLGKPHRFYRGFYNLRMSPVSREIAGVTLFFIGLGGYTLFSFFDGSWARLLANIAAAAGLLGLGYGGYYMYKLYRIPARPYWDHWHTGAAFIGSGLALGVLLLALAGLVFDSLNATQWRLLAGLVAVGMLLEGAGLVFHYRDLGHSQSEAAASFYEQGTTYGRFYWLRNLLLLSALLLACGMAISGWSDPLAFGLLALLVAASAVLGRAMFFVMVVPTTMPGAFFWRNKGFVEHARETGLADMPQLGVVYERHHEFRLVELLQTLRETGFKDKLDQLKRMFAG
ncbi:DmsC/YnfH family molybdoenzyme membrane anchor subunit [Thiolapillus sp.]